jgi:hypothetical protein
MGASVAELTASGRLVFGGGLLPSAAGGVSARLAGGEVIVTDGPFAEATEVIGGFAILQVDSREEALELTRQTLEMHRKYWPGWEGVCEVRQIAE